MSVLFTINLQNVSARPMISMKFTKIKVNYEIGAVLRKQTTNSNKKSSLQKIYSCSSGQYFPRFYEPEGSLTCSHETLVGLYPKPHLKEEALDRTMWRNRFGGGFGPVVRQNTE
jgi:hypothetical protein